MAKEHDHDRAGAPAPRGPHEASSRRRIEAHELGKYRFIAALGHGGMAEVFLAVARGPVGFNKLQVIKRLRPNLAEDAELRAMFLDEARLAARLNHRNVVQTNEVDMLDGQYFMAMEYLEGQPLHRVLGRAKEVGRALPRGVVLRVVVEALQGLQYAHDLADYDGSPLGVVHRDVSPQNVFVTYDGQVKIVDFGIAKAARRAVETDTGVIKGKLSYMAPEQAFLPSAEIDRRADVFSVGVILWEMLAGRRLWQDMSDPEIIAALLHDLPHLADAAPGADPELGRIADKALRRAREDRYPSAAAMRAEVERAGSPCSADDLGAFVDLLFRDDRDEIKALLARQVDLALHDGGSELLDLERGPLRGGGRALPSVPPSSGIRSTGSHAAVRLSEGEAEADLSSFGGAGKGTSGETPAPSTVTARRAAESGSDDGSDRGALFAHHRRERRRAPLFAGAVLALGVTAAIYLTTAARKEAPRAPAAVAASTPAAAAIPAPATSNLGEAIGGAPEGAYLRAHLGANPVEARILLDGAPLPSNPFDGKFLKDGAVHRLQFEAPGFLPQQRLIVFDKDLSIDVPLQPKPKPVEAPGMKPDPY